MVTEVQQAEHALCDVRKDIILKPKEKLKGTNECKKQRKQKNKKAKKNY